MWDTVFWIFEGACVLLIIWGLITKARMKKESDPNRTQSDKNEKKKINWEKLFLWLVYILIGPVVLFFGIKHIANGGQVYLAAIGLVTTGFPFYYKYTNNKDIEKYGERKYIKVVGQSKIKVTECDPVNAKALKMKRRFHTSYEHNPAQATYVGATVGGVHMGDWKVEEAYTSSRISGDTNKYELWYDEYKGSTAKQQYERHLVKEIQITVEMAKKAEKIPAVNKYLKGDTLVLENPDNSAVIELRKLLPYAHSQEDALNVTSRIMDEKALSQDEMTAVYNFLCWK